MQIIYLIVNGKVRPTPARIVGKIAEVKTPYGIREFGKFFLSESEALAAAKKKCNAGVTGAELAKRPR